MKKIKIFLFALLAPIAISCENEKSLAENEYRLIGEVKGMESGMLYAISYNDGAVKIDTLEVNDGNFTLEGKIEEPVKEIYLSPQPEIDYREEAFVSLYLEPGVMDLDLDAARIKEAKLTGSQTMEDYYSLQKTLAQIKEKYAKEHAAFMENWEKIGKATTEEEKKELKWKDDELRNDLEPYYNEVTEAQKAFILNNPQSYISFLNFPFVLNEFSQEEARAIYENFPEEFRTGERADRMEKDIEDMSKGIPGAVAGDFNTVDINGEPIKLEDFRGQYLLIDFWASWCVPCRKGNPHLRDLYAKYHPKGLEILGVSDDDSNPEAWRKAVKEDSIGVWRHVLRGMKIDRSGGGYKLVDDGVSGGYNISTLPTKILVGPDGIVVGRYGGGGESDEALDKKLAEIFGN